jgi:hypothetical protein
MLDMSAIKVDLRRIKSSVRIALDAGVVMTGLGSYFLGRGMPSAARQSALRLHCATNGRFTESMAPLLRRLRPVRPSRPASGFLGVLSTDKLEAIATAIRRDGFYVFDHRLPDALVEELTCFAAARPAFVPGVSKSPDERYVFDAAAPVGKKYSVVEDEIVQSQAMQQLMADASFLAVSETYLRTLPVIADTTLWWSAVHPGTAQEDAGQFYHFDFDTPPGWLMFFFYLTDVDSSHGPHVFVRGSHRPGHPAAAELRRRGYQRIEDREIEAAFGGDNIVEILGKRGTVLAVDTRGFHKGKPLEQGSRLMAQLIYTFPQFAGAHVAKQQLPPNLHPSLTQALARTPRLYQKFI